MGSIKSLPNQIGPLKADPCKEDHVMSNDKKTDDAGLDNWLELQKQASKQDRQMKELVTSHVEDQLRSIQTEADRGKWYPQELGTIE
jgi:hypothetical protein